MLDNIPIERFWRTVKYEEIYLKAYESVGEARQCLSAYIEWYNHKRRHSGINDDRPYEVMVGLQRVVPMVFNKKEMEETQACVYVDNSSSYHTYPQGPTTTTIKQQKVKLMTNHSSKIAA